MKNTKPGFGTNQIRQAPDGQIGCFCAVIGESAQCRIRRRNVRPRTQDYKRENQMIPRVGRHRRNCFLRILPELQRWRKPTIDSVYPIVWIDAIHYKVMDEKNRPVTHAIYNVLGLTVEGRKDLLGVYIARSDGAHFCLSVLTDLQNRGVQDILIACVDGLKGFPDLIANIYPQTTLQLCIIHQIHNSIRYVSSINQKEFMVDLK